MIDEYKRFRREPDLDQIKRLIEWYEQGVVFRCGCHEDRLEADVKQALFRGDLTTQTLFRCPLHWQPVITPAPELDQRWR
jgi:hypothetical protein